MSTSRIYSCLEHFTCRVTHRGAEVLKSSGFGLITGALSGAMLGGVAVGFTDLGFLESGKSDYKNKHFSEYPEVCKDVEHYKRGTGKYFTSECSRPGLDNAAGDYGLAYAKEQIGIYGPWIAIGTTLTGAVLGLLIGACHGWNKSLPAYESEADIEAQKSNISFARLG